LEAFLVFSPVVFIPRISIYQILNSHTLKKGKEEEEEKRGRNEPSLVVGLTFSR
jgi:hypothetical protein